MESFEINPYKVLNLDEIIMKINCEYNGQTCDLPEFMIHFLTKSSFLYCSTINVNKKPHIQPLIFVIESGKCSLTFLLYNQSIMKKSLHRNPNLSLTIDKTHPINPFWNSGIMIEAVSQLSNAQKDVQLCYENLQKKYNSDNVIKILGIDIIQKYTRLRALPKKIVFWKGPHFKQFWCKYRRKKKL